MLPVSTLKLLKRDEMVVDTLAVDSPDNLWDGDGEIKCGIKEP